MEAIFRFDRKNIDNLGYIRLKIGKCSMIFFRNGIILIASTHNCLSCAILNKHVYCNFENIAEKFFFTQFKELRRLHDSVCRSVTIDYFSHHSSRYRAMCICVCINTYFYKS